MRAADGFSDGVRVGPAVVDTVGVMVGSREGTMEEGVRDGRSRINCYCKRQEVSDT